MDDAVTTNSDWETAPPTYLDVALSALKPMPEYWVASNALKFVKMKDGRHILHQLWTSTVGNHEWRPVPLEDEA